MNRAALFAILVILGILWGLTIPATKVAVSSGSSPLGLLFWQAVNMTVILGAIAAARRTRIDLSARALNYALVICLTGIVVPGALLYYAALNLPAGVLAILIASVPMFALTIALSLRVEPFVPTRSLGIVLGIAAVALLMGPQTSLPEPWMAPFVLVALGSALCYGIEAVYIDLRMPERADPVVVLFTASVISVVLSAPLAWFTGNWVNLIRPWELPEWALLFSAMCSSLAYSGYIWLVARAGGVFSSQVAYIITIAGVIASAVLLRESYSSWVWAALALMMVGLALVQPGQRERA